MVTVRQSAVFASWLHRLSDDRAVARIGQRIRRIEMGNFGDAKPIGGSVSELRIDYGPGYRVYFARRGKMVVILLCGGDKKSQRKDITAALKMAKEI